VVGDDALHDRQAETRPLLLGGEVGGEELVDHPFDGFAIGGLAVGESSAQLHDILDESVPGRVMELLGGAGWPPGLRVAASLRSALEDNDLTQIRGRVVGCRIGDDRRILSVTTEDGEEHASERFVLATGAVVGGGIVLDRTLHEAVLGLPVVVQGAPVRPAVNDAGIDPRGLFAEDAGRTHPLATAGIRVDAQGRPVDGDGRVVHPNLVACGSILAPAEGEQTLIDPGRSALGGWTAAGRLL
jgi:glycerol-3-phosphate dehydrogenase subunit B